MSSLDRNLEGIAPVCMKSLLPFDAAIQLPSTHLVWAESTAPQQLLPELRCTNESWREQIGDSGKKSPREESQPWKKMYVVDPKCKRGEGNLGSAKT